jgi:hypothetical protein
MTDEYINQANPMTSVGGMIKPSTWAKYTPEAKAQMTGVANRYPQAFKEKVLDNPMDIYTKMDDNLRSGVAGNYRPGYVVSSTVDAPAVIKLNSKMHPEDLQTGRILEHELLHNENEVSKRATNTDPNDAWTIARLLQSKIPSNVRGSLDRIVDENTVAGKGWDKWDTRQLMEQGPRTHATEGWAAMDEALAHLSEASSRPGASPEIRKLAKDMGVSWEDKTKEVLFGGKNSPKWNPRDVPMPPRGMPAAVDISRSRISQGALEAFQALKQKLGLDATFGKFKGPAEPGGKVLSDMAKDIDLNRVSSEIYPTGVSRDQLISHIMDNIAQGMTSGGMFKPSVNQIRKNLGGGAPLSKFRGILQHLDKYGLVNEEALEPHLRKISFGEAYEPEFHPEVLKRLKRFIEETKE